MADELPGGELDDLHGLLSYDVGPEDAPRGAGDYELAVAVGASVYDPAVQVSVGHDRNGAVFVAILVAGLALGEADAPVLGVGETAVRDDGVPVASVLAEHGVLGEDRGFPRS